MDRTVGELDLDAIEARAKAATQGPWEYDGCSVTDWGVTASHTITMEWMPNGRGDGTNERESPDGQFIAHAREDVPALIAELRKLREESRWIPVEERLPEDNVDILMWNDILAEIGHYSLKSRSFVTHGYCTQFATHWQPLPSRPNRPNVK